MKFLKDRKYKVGVVLLITVLFICSMTSCYAAINIPEDEPDNSGIKNTMSLVLNFTSTGILGGAIVPLINVFNLIILVILYMIFIGTGTTANNFAFPFPDQIIFNRIPLLDPNFINPDAQSIGGKVNLLLKNTYYSFFVLAVTIFTIAALVIGIKLVFSSLATEKAKYKESLNNWIFGIVMLFLVHYLLAGMFYLNEQIVKNVSNTAGSISFPVDVGNLITGLGTLTGLFTLGPAGGIVGTIVGKSVKNITTLANVLVFNADVNVYTVPGYGRIDNDVRFKSYGWRYCIFNNLFYYNRTDICIGDYICQESIYVYIARNYGTTCCCC